jgi:hypothetical protein
MLCYNYDNFVYKFKNEQYKYQYDAKLNENQKQQIFTKGTDN